MTLLDWEMNVLWLDQILILSFRIHPTKDPRSTVDLFPTSVPPKGNCKGRSQAHRPNQGSSLPLTWIVSLLRTSARKETHLSHNFRTATKRKCHQNKLFAIWVNKIPKQANHNEALGNYHWYLHWVLCSWEQHEDQQGGSWNHAHGRALWPWQKQVS